MVVEIPLVGTFIAPGFMPTLALGLFIFCLALYRYKIEKVEEPSNSNSQDNEEIQEEKNCQDCSCDKIKRVSILYGTTTGNAKDFAWKLAQELENDEGFDIEVNNVANIDAEEFLPVESGKKGSVLVLIISTYTEGTPPESASWFYKWLEESAKDFRIQHSLLKGLKFAVFGLGNSLYSDNFNTIGKNCDKFLHQLSGERISSLKLGDENVSESKNGSLEGDFEAWKTKLVTNIHKRNDKKETPEVIEEYESEEDSDNEAGSDGENDDLVDLEDLGNVMKKAKSAQNAQPKEMLTSSLRQSLTKQGYKLIGSHSGVKICRWTKAMLRGRGGCYKHTFYGIESHR